MQEQLSVNVNGDNSISLLAHFEDARYAFPRPLEIYEIACEELDPFLSGDCSAGEAAK